MGLLPTLDQNKNIKTVKQLWDKEGVNVSKNGWPGASPITHFTIVIYDSRVVWLVNCPYYDSRVEIYIC